ncbi:MULTISPECIES: hypothetical protein [Virgibacillus]|uniref:Uncharacterized protein n=1 Tax=Virgibacillus massiliensis TaxID=1462526 RepID=A0A024QA65_9BACI|nr:MULTISPECIES: hypothetical protein [Virgibacillus]MYL40089.1 hypothetical protein [Virgibacillus massiliensis]CDQ39167.1 hypothetical protein BN990_01452 [Virgibacillus massiliensis]
MVTNQILILVIVHPDRLVGSILWFYVISLEMAITYCSKVALPDKVVI